MDKNANDTITKHSIYANMNYKIVMLMSSSMPGRNLQLHEHVT